MDTAFTHWVNSLSEHWPLLDALMVLTSAVGVPLLIAMVIATWWLGSDAPGDRHLAVSSGLAFVTGLALNQIVLLFLYRVRPYDNGITHLLIARSADPSFPSDHATATFSIVFTYLLHRRWRLVALFGAGAVLVVFARVFVGTHYVTDVLGGMGTAGVAAIAIRFAYRKGTRLDRWVTSIL